MSNFELKYELTLILAHTLNQELSDQQGIRSSGYREERGGRGNRRGRGRGDRRGGREDRDRNNRRDQEQRPQTRNQAPMESQPSNMSYKMCY